MVSNLQIGYICLNLIFLPCLLLLDILLRNNVGTQPIWYQKKTQELSKQPSVSSVQNVLYNKTSLHPGGVGVTEKETGQFVLRKNLQTYDPLTLQTPLPFLPNYRNPCFKDEYSKLYCLPYFFILVAQKSGTTDLYRKLTSHHMISANIKEFHWWNRMRLMSWPKNIQRNLQQYMNWYKSSTAEIQNVVVPKEDHLFHPLVLGDGTASSLYDQLFWRKIPQNKGLSHPAVISAHVIKHVLPNAKFIVILRNPTDRLYSDYTFFNKNVSDAEELHVKVTEGVSWFQDCLANKVQINGSCIYDIPEYRDLSNLSTSWNPVKPWDPVIRLRAGLYSEFLMDWFKVFPRKQFYIFTLDQFSKEQDRLLKEMYRFLELEPPLKNNSMVSLNKKTLQTSTLYKVPFFNKTKQLLDTFYRPYNIKLSKLLHSETVLWDNHNKS